MTDEMSDVEMTDVESDMIASRHKPGKSQGETSDKETVNVDNQDKLAPGSESSIKDIIEESNMIASWDDLEPSISPGEISGDEKKIEADQWALVLGDIRLTSEEASCLDNECWLLDVAIEFFLEYLCRIKWSKYKDSIEIIGPCVAQMLKMCKNAEDIMGQLKPLNLKDRTLVLIPVNNAHDQESKGCHWSLLIFFPKEEIFHHIDSLYPMNKESAWKIAVQIDKGLDLDNGTFDHHHELEEYQQENKFDCGLFVLENAEQAITQTFIDQIDISELVSCQKTCLPDKREELREILKNLKSESD